MGDNATTSNESPPGAMINDDHDTSMLSHGSSENDESLGDTDMHDTASIFDSDDRSTHGCDSASSISVEETAAEDTNDENNDNGEDEHEQTTNQQGNSDTSQRKRILRETNAKLLDITKLLQQEFAKNPLSTQQILIREAGDIYKRYSEHGSYLRLSENVMNFLKQGDIITRPTVKKQSVQRVVKDDRTGELKIIEQEEPGRGLDRAKMAFAPIPSQVNTNIHGQHPAHVDVSELQPLSYENNGAESSIQNLQAGSDNCCTREPCRQNVGQRGQADTANTTTAAATINEEATGPKTTGITQNPSVQLKSIRQLLPDRFILNHDHPYTMTTDPETHSLLDPAHPDQIPFNPVDTNFLISKDAILPPGALQAINNIFRLTHVNANHFLNYLSVKYTPLPTSTLPNPPAPPFALFRLGIQQHTRAALDNQFTTARHDSLSMGPNTRLLLKDLFDNHQRGRGGLNSLDSFYSLSDDLRRDSWLIGREHLSGAALNQVEMQILERVTGVVGEVCDVWWEERFVALRAWGFLRCWVREQEVRKVLSAKWDGTY